jgi:hypothetical protein
MGKIVGSLRRADCADIRSTRRVSADRGRECRALYC